MNKPTKSQKECLIALIIPGIFFTILGLVVNPIIGIGVFSMFIFILLAHLYLIFFIYSEAELKKQKNNKIELEIY